MIEKSHWLMLIVSLPAQPAYHRVKIWRRLQALGSIAIKNAVHILPDRDSSREDFNWIMRDVLSLGGEAYVCQPHFLEGMTDETLIALFNNARNKEYAALASDVTQVSSQSDLPSFDTLGKFRTALLQIKRIDFFGADGAATAEQAIAKLASMIQSSPLLEENLQETQKFPHGNIWVTRQNLFVDRLASAWLIKRFIDPQAQFKFVDEQEYKHRAGEIAFDMYQGEFTHQDGLCTFEVLLRSTGLKDQGLKALAERIHDIDLKDNLYAHPDTTGLEQIIRAQCQAAADDAERLEKGHKLFNDLYEYFQKSKPVS